ncbi:hypothetical protein T492DRAFT_975538, partial [Pavlovales sp. CCMP2436]
MAAEYGRVFTLIVSDVDESNINRLREGHAAGLAAARAIATLRSAGGGSSSAAGSESAGTEQRQRAANYGLGTNRGSGWRVTSLKRCSCRERKHSGIPCRHSLLVGQLFARLWLTSSFEAGQLHRARSHLYAFIRRAAPSTFAAEPSTTWTERVQMLVNETRHLAQLAAKVTTLMEEMWRALGVLYRKAAGLNQIEALHIVIVSGSARMTTAAASGAASLAAQAAAAAAAAAGAQPTSALPPLSTHWAGNKRTTRIDNARRRR